MQYVRSLGGSVSKTWNSINPATLSGAIDVIVIEQEDGKKQFTQELSHYNTDVCLSPIGTLACSPFHVRFGKFSLLRPFEKKVEFSVNGVKQNYAMKLGEGGEAFFVFETTDEIPASLQTSPLVSPASSPQVPGEEFPPSLPEPDYLDLEKEGDTRSERSKSPEGIPISRPTRVQTDFGMGNFQMERLRMILLISSCRSHHASFPLTR